MPKDLRHNGHGKQRVLSPPQPLKKKFLNIAKKQRQTSGTLKKQAVAGIAQKNLKVLKPNPLHRQIPSVELYLDEVKSIQKSLQQ